MSFQTAVEDAPAPVNGAYRSGLQALEGRHRSLVTCEATRRLTGSIFLDSVLAQDPNHANQPRWDYGLGYMPENGAEQAVWVEVHTATTREATPVLDKLQWLKNWLNSNADQLLRMTNEGDKKFRFVWIASGRVNIPPHTPQAKKLAMSKIGKVRRKLSLP